MKGTVSVHHIPQLKYSHHHWDKESVRLEVILGGLKTNLLLKTGSMLNSKQVAQFKLPHHRIRKPEEKGRNIQLGMQRKARNSHLWLRLNHHRTTYSAEWQHLAIFTNPGDRQLQRKSHIVLKQRQQSLLYVLDYGSSMGWLHLRQIIIWLLLISTVVSAYQSYLTYKEMA